MYLLFVDLLSDLLDFLVVSCCLPAVVVGGADLERRWMLGKELERVFFFEAYISKQPGCPHPHSLL